MSRIAIIQPEQSYTFSDYFKLNNEDLERGFVQLAIELIALDQWIESDQPILYGAISTGNIWQFGRFDRQTRAITQDLDLYRVPADLNDLLRILINILEPQIST
jgi:hypothetical protein